MKTQALARKQGYRNQYAEWVDQLREWGCPEEILEPVAKFMRADGFAIPPNNETAAAAFLERFNRGSAPIRAWAIVRGLIGEPKEGPPTTCQRCGGDGYEPDTTGKRPDCSVCNGRGRVPGAIYLKPDPKIVQIADERAHGKPTQAVKHGIDSATREMIERVLGGKIEEKYIEGRVVELLEAENDDDS